MFKIFHWVLIFNIWTLAVVAWNFSIDRKDLSEYIEKVTQNYIFEIERLGSSKLPLPDFTQNINKSYFAYDVCGYVNFTNGQIGYLGKPILHPDRYNHNFVNLTHVSVFWPISLEHKRIYFDYYAELSVDTYEGIVAFNISNMDVEFRVLKDFTTGELYPKLSYVSRQKRPMHFIPTNKYLDIIASENVYEPFDDMPLLEETVFNNVLYKVVSKIPFPEIRFIRSL